MKPHFLLPMLLGLTAPILLAACTPSEPAECTDANTPGCMIASDKQRITDPGVSDAELQAFSNGNTAFALDLYAQLRKDPKNLFYSPHSISVALGMTWAGAKTQTEIDMAAVLGFVDPQEKVHASFNALDYALESRAEAATNDERPFRLNVANALWGQVGFPFEAPFLDTLALNYGAGMHVVDFDQAPGQAADLINSWVLDRTEGKIDKLVTEELLSQGAKLVLTNAIYFNASWNEPFKAENTKDGDFHTLAGSTVSVPLMHGGVESGYVKTDTYEAVSLPYDGEKLDMVIVLPSDGEFDNFESGLDADAFAKVVEGLTNHAVDVTMPKFKLDGEFSLSKALSSMGMEVAFSGEADFSGMVKGGGLQIQDVIHKSFVSVDESGTEAAAATAVIVGETSAPEPATIVIDRPFFFVIRDRPTNSLLFVGRVIDPT